MALVGAGLVTALTWPMVPQLGRVGRLETSDGRFSIWNVAWIDHALLTAPRHVFDANIFWPHTGTLAYSEPNLVAGLFGLPFYAVTHNPLAALNGAVFVALVLAFVCAWALVRRLTGSSAAGMVSAALFTFCPYVQGHTAHIQLLMIFVLPLALLAFHRLLDAPTLARGCVLGAALAVAALSCGYYGIFTGLFIGAAALLFAGRRRIYWTSLAAAVGSAAVFVAPVLIPFLRIRGALGTAPVYTPDQIEVYAATAAKYASSSSIVETRLLPHLLPSGLTSVGGPGELLFPGLVLLGLTLAGLVVMAATPRDRSIGWRYVALAGLSIWLSFGPAGGLYMWLDRIVPFMSLLRAPGRIGIGVVLALAVVAGFAVRRIVVRAAWMLPVLLIIGAADLYSPWPIVPADPLPRAYQVLATLPRGVTVDFPFPYQPEDFHNHTHAMFWSTYHWQPLVNGYSDMTPPDFTRIATPINDFPELHAFALMRAYDVRYVVWHVDAYRGGAREALLARFPAAQPYLRPIVTDGDVWLYEIVAWPQAAG